MTTPSQQQRHRNLLRLDLLLQRRHVLVLQLADVLHRQAVPFVDGGHHLSLHLSVHYCSTPRSPVHVALLVVHHVLAQRLEPEVLEINVQKPIVARHVLLVFA